MRSTSCEDFLRQSRANGVPRAPDNGIAEIEMRDSAESVVYMDYAATTPVDPRVAEAMAECLTLEGTFANASSTGHRPGIAARRRVEEAREQVAQLIGAEPAEVVWTSGATESDNLAILGVARFHRDRGNHLVTAKTEHKA